MHHIKQSTLYKLCTLLLILLTMAGSVGILYSIPDLSTTAYAASINEPLTITVNKQDTFVGDDVIYTITPLRNLTATFSIRSSVANIATIENQPDFMSANKKYQLIVHINKSGCFRLIATTAAGETITAPRVNGNFWFIESKDRNNQTMNFLWQTQIAYNKLPLNIRRYLSNHECSYTVLNSRYVGGNAVGTTGSGYTGSRIKLGGLYDDPQGLLLHETGHAIFNACRNNNSKLNKEFMAIYPGVTQRYKFLSSLNDKTSYTLFNQSTIENPHELFAQSVFYYYLKANQFKNKYNSLYNFMDRVLNNFDAYVQQNYQNVRILLNGNDIGALTQVTTVEVKPKDVVQISEPYVKDTKDRMALYFRKTYNTDIETDSLKDRSILTENINNNSVYYTFYDGFNPNTAKPVCKLRLIMSALRNKSRLVNTSINLGETAVINVEVENPGNNALTTTVQTRKAGSSNSDNVTLIKDTKKTKINFTPKETGTYIITVTIQNSFEVSDNKTLILTVK